MTDYPSVVTLVQELFARRDPYNHHLLRTGNLAAVMADVMGLTPPVSELFVIAANMHDLGKLLIREDVLNLPRKLSIAEFASVKQHSVLGYKVALASGYDPLICDVILHHHENLDGTGYPDRLAGAAISIYARAIHVIDVWDAMNSKRPYRAPINRDEVLAEMNALSGKQFDPELLQLFLKQVVHEEGV